MESVFLYIAMVVCTIFIIIALWCVDQSLSQDLGKIIELLEEDARRTRIRDDQ